MFRMTTAFVHVTAAMRIAAFSLALVLHRRCGDRAGTILSRSSRCVSSCRSRPAASPISRRDWWPRSSATNSASTSSSRISRAPAALRRHAPTLAGGADGYTLTLLTNSAAISVPLFAAPAVRSGERFRADLRASANFPVCFVVGAASPLHTLDDMLKAARDKPGTLNVGTINVGSTQNLAAELFKSTHQRRRRHRAVSHVAR